jgi:hypothetical protein
MTAGLPEVLELSRIGRGSRQSFGALRLGEERTMKTTQSTIEIRL